MTRRLSFADVRAVVAKVPDLSGIVLVGGQALNFWAETLGIADADAAGLYGPALSDDIDFLGSARAAIAFGTATGGKVAVANWESVHSPNTALVTLDIDGESHLIDFLSSMKGFLPNELERVHSWAVPLKLGQEAPRPMSVMHPAHCLQAQLENVYGHGLNRRAEPGGARYVGRVRLAVEACRRITLRHAEQGDPRSALKVAEKVHELSLLPSAMRAFVEDGLRVDLGIADTQAMPKEFLTKRLPQLRREHAHAIEVNNRRRASSAERPG